jgi:hypothetical protein
MINQADAPGLVRLPLSHCDRLKKFAEVSGEDLGEVVADAADQYLENQVNVWYSIRHERKRGPAA